MHLEIEVRDIIILKDIIPTVADSATQNSNLQHTLCARNLLEGRHKKCASELR